MRPKVGSTYLRKGATWPVLQIQKSYKKLFFVVELGYVQNWPSSTFLRYVQADFGSHLSDRITFNIMTTTFNIHFQLFTFNICGNILVADFLKSNFLTYLVTNILFFYLVEKRIKIVGKNFLLFSNPQILPKKVREKWTN